MSPKVPVSIRASDDTLNRLLILNKLSEYPPHQVKSKFFALLIKDRCEYLIEELSKKENLSETEALVLKELMDARTK